MRVKYVVIKAVIFDLDGTIANFNLDYKALRAESRGYLIKMGVPASLLSIKEDIFEMLKKTELYLKNAQKPADTMKEIRKEVFRLAEMHEAEAAALTSLFPGSMETIKSLKAMGLKVGLCTVNSASSTKRILERFKLAKYFDAVITRNEVAKFKPDPEHCKAALNALDVSTPEVVFVGDSIMDM
ncbi:MAG: HAD family phosphatase [Candidatus Bathyarchaeota archaeon]|nr:HAD family phosphatase [Candidatus Bathyarchaeota archaeon]